MQRPWPAYINAAFHLFSGNMTILKGIPRVINPKLLFALARMGHGDEIVLADANFPSASVAASTTIGEEIRIDGTGIPEILEAVMKLMPLDPVAKSGIFMEMMPEHKAAGWKTVSAVELLFDDPLTPK